MCLYTALYRHGIGCLAGGLDLYQLEFIVVLGNRAHTDTLDFCTKMNRSLDGLGHTFEDVKKVCEELAMESDTSLARWEVTSFVRLNRSKKTPNNIRRKELEEV